MAKTVGLIILFIFCALFLLHDANQFPVVKDWCALGVAELCAQLLISGKKC